MRFHFGTELRFSFEEVRNVNFEQLRKCELELRKFAQFDSASKDVKQFSESNKGNFKKLTYEQKKVIVDMLVEKVEISLTIKPIVGQRFILGLTKRL